MARVQAPQPNEQVLLFEQRYKGAHNKDEGIQVFGEIMQVVEYDSDRGLWKVKLSSPFVARKPYDSTADLYLVDVWISPRRPGMSRDVWGVVESDLINSALAEKA